MLVLLRIPCNMANDVYLVLGVGVLSQMRKKYRVMFGEDTILSLIAESDSPSNDAVMEIYFAKGHLSQYFECECTLRSR